MSSSYKWLRLYAEFSTDPKVQMMTEQDQRRLVMLFCIRCGNATETFHDDQIAFQLRITIDEWMHTKDIFLRNGFINSDNKLLNWDKRQYASDLSTSRVKKHRNMKKQLLKHDGNVSVTPPDTDTDTDIKKKKINKKEKPTRFEEFWSAYPERAAGNARKPASDKYAILVRDGVTEDALIEGAKKYAEQYRKANGNDGGKFIKMAVTWLNQCCWQEFHGDDYVAPPPEVEFPEGWPPHWQRSEMRLRKLWVDGYWIEDDHGPRPDQSGCQVPEHVLIKWREMGMKVLLPSEEGNLL